LCAPRLRAASYPRIATMAHVPRPPRNETTTADRRARRTNPPRRAPRTTKQSHFGPATPAPNEPTGVWASRGEIDVAQTARPGAKRSHFGGRGDENEPTPERGSWARGRGPGTRSAVGRCPGAERTEDCPAYEVQHPAPEVSERTEQGTGEDGTALRPGGADSERTERDTGRFG
jgi:hypothetical protein